MRLDKFLCDSGFGTRTEVKNFIKNKRIMVDSAIVTDSSYKIDPERSVVVFDGNKISYSEYTYIVLNKPQNCVTARNDNNDKTVMDLIDCKIKDLSPVGRLDKDTEGILLITNNGKLNHNMLSPSKHVDKTYYVELLKDISDEDILKLSEGVDIGDDKMTMPATVNKISERCIELTICEGRYHQVKRMLEAVDNKVVFLKRIMFGPLHLTDDLKTGQYRELCEEELALLEKYMK